jgi:hypothetical protein
MHRQTRCPPKNDKTPNTKSQPRHHHSPIQNQPSTIPLLPPLPPVLSLLLLNMRARGSQRKNLATATGTWRLRENPEDLPRQKANRQARQARQGKQNTIVIPISMISTAACDAIVALDSPNLAPLAPLAVFSFLGEIVAHSRFSYGTRSVPATADFWNCTHEARIQAFLEHELCESA